MNFEAENVIDRFVWRLLVPSLIVVVVAVIAFVYFLR